MTIIWCMVPEIRSTADIIFSYFGQFFALLPHSRPKKSKFWKNKKNSWVIIMTWDIVHDGCKFHFGLFFALLHPKRPKKSKPKKWKKWKNKRIPGDIIILHLCMTNYDRMIYSSWYMVCEEQMDRQTEKVTYRGGCPT